MEKESNVLQGSGSSGSPSTGTSSGLGLIGFDSFHFVVENLERSRHFYTEVLDFKEVARAGDDLVARSGQQSIVFGAGDARVCVSTPLAQKSKAARYLRRHPAGVMSLSFRVQNLDAAAKFLEERGGTFLSDPLEAKDERGGTYRAFEIATPLGDVAFRFIERNDFKAFAPGFTDSGKGNAVRPDNMFGIAGIDHVTSNGLTMQPIIAWYRDVLGFVPFWEISFHTNDVAEGRASGSGLRSIVMWDPASGVKFATNEPLRPFFRDSQITKFVEDNAGNGVQHVAFAVTNIISSVEELKRRGVQFMGTHPAYYRDLPGRLAKLGIHNVKEELAELERLGILVDGSHERYMLQIFMQEAAALYDESRAGPFFYEIIQRAGDAGFGFGNFRALFESIERAQKAEAAAAAVAKSGGESR
ncbi:4-hydroxyphenylpyruvate dioxygenase family protein [Pendulispora albinea]|uniref:VOC family protein n=1 Tax=Pendulispora albinea TaxID=2741071 RepID=A0ABZ2LS80_9BACT